MYHPTTRVLAVLALLQSRGRMTGSELAQCLEVNARTVRDYITMLQDLGAPIYADRGRNGAYVLEAGFKLPPMMFTEDEALALAVGLLAARHFGLAEIVPAAENARVKLEQEMPPDLTTRMRALVDTVTLALDTNATSHTSSSQILLSVSGAAQARRRVFMRYHSGQGTETERDFDPYGLAFHRGSWYVVGFCHLRDDLRSFRLDRIVGVELSDTSFDPPKYFNALAYVVQSIPTMPRAFNYEVLLKTDLATAQREYMSTLGTLELTEDGVTLRGTAEDIDWVARQLAKVSFNFVVRQPDALRLALRKRAEELMHMADAH